MAASNKKSNNMPSCMLRLTRRRYRNRFVLPAIRNQMNRSKDFGLFVYTGIVLPFGFRLFILTRLKDASVWKALQTRLRQSAVIPKNQKFEHMLLLRNCVTFCVPLLVTFGVPLWIFKEKKIFSRPFLEQKSRTQCDDLNFWIDPLTS